MHDISEENGKKENGVQYTSKSNFSNSLKKKNTALVYSSQNSLVEKYTS